MEIPAPLAIASNPPLSYRFLVIFLIGGVVPNPIDFMFQKVSGLESSIATIAVEEGGQNFYTQQLPKKVQHGNITLERGMAVGSPLVIETNIAMTLFKFATSNVLISLLDAAADPIANWLLMNAYPVRWSVTDFDANQNTVVIERFELSYQNMMILRV